MNYLRGKKMSLIIVYPGKAYVEWGFKYLLINEYHNP